MSGLEIPLLPQPEKDHISARKFEEDSKSLSLEDLFPQVLSHMAKSNAIRVEIESSLGAAIDFEDGILVGTESGQVLTFTPNGTRTFLGAHQASVGAVAARGNVGVSGGTDGALKVWNLSLRVEVSSERAHEGGVRAVHMLNHDQRLLSIGENGDMKLWTTSPLKELHCVSPASESKLVALRSTSDNAKVITGSENGTVKVWNLDDLSELATFLGHTSKICQIVMTAESKLVITGDIDGAVKVWSLESLKEVATLIPFDDRLRSLSVTPNGEWVYGAGDRMKIIAWNLKDLSQVVMSGHEYGNYYCMALSDIYLVTASGDKSVRIWDMRTKTTYAVLRGHTEGVQLAFVNSTSEKLFAVTESTVWIWNFDLDKSDNLEHKGSVKGLSISASTETLVTCSSDCTAKVWNLNRLKVVKTLSGHASGIVSVCTSHNGQLLATGAEDGEVKFWRVDAEAAIGSYTAHQTAIKFIAQCPNTDLFFSGDSSGLIIAWSFQDCKEVANLSGHTDAITRIVPSPTRDFIVSISKDGLCVIWNTKTFQKEKSFHADTSIWGLDVDSDYIMTGDSERMVRAYQASDFKSIGSGDCTTSTICTVALISGRNMAVTGCCSGYIQVWDLQPFALHQVIDGGHGLIEMLKNIKNSNYFISASRDFTVTVWSIEVLQCVAVFPKHSSYITDLGISPCGNYVFSCGDDGKLCRHDIFLFNNSPTPSPQSYESYTGNFLFSECLKGLMNGKSDDSIVAQKTALPLKINSLHVSAYYNQSKQLTNFLKWDVPIVCGAFGSPLSLALFRNTRKCIDEIMIRINDLLEQGKGWISVQNITNDIPELLKKASPHILKFFTKILRKSTQEGLPPQIVPLGDLPLTQFMPDWRVRPSLFAEMENSQVVTKGSEGIDFLVTEFKWNYVAGTPESVLLLTALSETEDTEILKTDFVQKLTNYKWNQFWTVTFLHTLLYAMLLIVLVWITFLEDKTNFIPYYLFLVLNAFFVVYEITQMMSGGVLDYWKDPWNYVDVVRAASAIWFGISCSKNWGLNLVVVAMCFFRGFTFFRTFKMTRMFVRLTLDVVGEMYSFLIILAYSTLSFGMIYAVLFQVSSPVEAWTIGYMILMGDYSTEDSGFIQWLCFTSVTLVNIIIMLNLLISILGDAYARAQEYALVNDTLAQLNVILEYESLMFWRKHSKQVSVLTICQEEVREEQDEDRDYLDSQFAKVFEQSAEVKGRLARVEEALLKQAKA